MCGSCCGAVPVEKRGEAHKDCAAECYNAPTPASVRKLQIANRDLIDTIDELRSRVAVAEEAADAAKQDEFDLIVRLTNVEGECTEVRNELALARETVARIVALVDEFDARTPCCGSCGKEIVKCNPPLVRGVHTFTWTHAAGVAADGPWCDGSSSRRAHRDTVTVPLAKLRAALDGKAPE